MQLGVIYYLIVIIFLSSLINSTFGFGFALVSMPILSLVFDLSILGPLIPLLFLVGSMIIVIRNWKLIQFKSTFIIVFTAMIFIPIGVYLGKYGDGRMIKAILGISIILFALYNLLLPKIPHLKRSLIQEYSTFANIIRSRRLNIVGFSTRPIKRRKRPKKKLKGFNLNNDTYYFLKNIT